MCTTIPNRIVHEKALDYYSVILRDHAPIVHFTAKRSLYVGTVAHSTIIIIIATTAVINRLCGFIVYYKNMIELNLTVCVHFGYILTGNLIVGLRM